jgi:hypothetical protein
MASGYSAARYDAERQVGVEGPSAGDACTSAGAPRTNRGEWAAPRPAIPAQKDEGGLQFASEPAVLVPSTPLRARNPLQRPLLAG